MLKKKWGQVNAGKKQMGASKRWKNKWGQVNAGKKQMGRK